MSEESKVLSTTRIRRAFTKRDTSPTTKTKLELEPQEEELPFPGRPGFRTKTGRSGLDPMDTCRELGYMQGLFYRNLFTGRLRTRNRLYLALMAIVGLGAFMPVLCAVVQLVGKGLVPGGLLVCATPLTFFGLALLVNLAINLKTML